MLRAVVILVAMVAPAVAQPKSPPIDRDLQAGIDAFRLGNYGDARAALDRARANDPGAAAPYRYLAAVAHAQLKFDECIASTRRALTLMHVSAARDLPARGKAPPKNDDLAETRALHETCRVASGRVPAGDLGESAGIAVTSNVIGATVRIGGLVYGGTPIAPRPITVGRLAVVVDKPGYKHFEIAIETMPGIVTDVYIELEPGVDTETAPAPRTGSLLVRLPDARGARLYVDGAATTIPTDGRVVVPPGVRLVELQQSGKDPWRRRVVVSPEHDTVVAPVFSDRRPRETRHRLGLVSTGLGGALLALGVGAFYISRDAVNEANDIVRVEIGRAPGETSPPIRTRADFEAARDKASRWGTISTVAYAGGFAAGGLGLYLLLTNQSRDDDAPAFAITATHGGAVISRAVTW